MSHIIEAVWLLGQQLGLWQLIVVGCVFVLLFVIPAMVKKVISQVRGFFGTLNQVEGVVVDPATGELLWL